MDIVVKLPDKDYSVILAKIMFACYGCEITELPKGHGRLIDVDNIFECEEMADDSFEWGVYVVKTKYIRDIPTIIPADKESEEEE